MYSEVKDSGARQNFSTGAVRDTAEGKGRYDLLPTYALQRLAQHFENGAKKYGDENWRKGIPLRRYVDSAIRHLFKYLEGQRDEDHAIAAAWNILAMVETEEMIRREILPPSLNNLPDWVTIENLGTAMPEHDLEPSQDIFDTVMDEVFGNDAFNLLPENLMGMAPVDLDACGTIDGVTPLSTPLITHGAPDPHAAETARQFNAFGAYDPDARPSGRVRQWVGGTVKWLSEN